MVHRLSAQQHLSRPPKDESGAILYVSHHSADAELRDEPLLAELIKRSAENPSLLGDIRQLAGDLQASAISLVELVTNVLDVTRFDTDKLELRESDFPLAALLDEEIRQLQPLAQAKNLSLELARVNRGYCDIVSPIEKRWKADS